MCKKKFLVQAAGTGENGDVSILPLFHSQLLIFIGNQIDIEPQQLLTKLDKLKEYAELNDADKTVEMLCDIVPTFNHKTN